jgi:hypothetical protein
LISLVQKIQELNDFIKTLPKIDKSGRESNQEMEILKTIYLGNVAVEVKKPESDFYNIKNAKENSPKSGNTLRKYNNKQKRQQNKEEESIDLIFESLEFKNRLETDTKMNSITFDMDDVKKIASNIDKSAVMKNILYNISEICLDINNIQKFSAKEFGNKIMKLSSKDIVYNKNEYKFYTPYGQTIEWDTSIIKSYCELINPVKIFKSIDEIVRGIVNLYDKHVLEHLQTKFGYPNFLFPNYISNMFVPELDLFLQKMKESEKIYQQTGIYDDKLKGNYSEFVKNIEKQWQMEALPFLISSDLLFSKVEEENMNNLEKRFKELSCVIIKYGPIQYVMRIAMYCVVTINTYIKEYDALSRFNCDINRMFQYTKECMEINTHEGELIYEITEKSDLNKMNQFKSSSQLALQNAVLYIENTLNDIHQYINIFLNGNSCSKEFNDGIDFYNSKKFEIVPNIQIWLDSSIDSLSIQKWFNDIVLINGINCNTKRFNEITVFKKLKTILMIWMVNGMNVTGKKYMDIIVNQRKDLKIPTAVALMKYCKKYMCDTVILDIKI